MRKQIIKKGKNNVHDYPGRVQPVVAVQPNGKVVGFFDSIKLAVEHYGYSRDGITNCCRGRQRLCGGLNWFYEKDYKAIYFSKDTEALKTHESDTRNDDGTFKKGHHFNRGVKRKVDKERCRANMKRQRQMGWLKPKPSNQKPVLELETGRIFPSIGHAAIETGYTYAGMANILHHPHKAQKTGYHYCLKKVYDRIHAGDEKPVKQTIVELASTFK